MTTVVVQLRYSMSMGQISKTQCRSCGHEFELAEGGGFRFHLLRCDRCGETVSMSFEQLGELHLRFIKGLTGPYCVATREEDEVIQRTFSGSAISCREYEEAIEDRAGACACGGVFKFNAPPRCPRCRSTDLESRADPHIMFD